MSTAIWSSFENQRSLTTLIGFRFPICPAGIVVVIRVPSALTPSIWRVPSDSTIKLLLVVPWRATISSLSATFFSSIDCAFRSTECTAIFAGLRRASFIRSSSV